MKKTTQLLTALVFCSLIIFIGCNRNNGTDDPDPRDVQAALLTTGTWSLSSATVDGTAREEWTGFTLGFAYNNDSDQGTMTASGVPSDEGADAVFANGNWTFDGTDENADVGVIVRADGIEMSITTLNETTLTLSFNVPEASGRIASFDGNWVFTFSR